MSKLYLNHKRVFIASVVLILSVVLVTFLAIYFVAIKSEKTPIAIDENGNELISGKVYDMPSNLMFMSDVEEVSDNDGILLKATVKPLTALDKSLSWSVAWKDSSETFASNNNISDVITITEKSSDTAQIKCLKPFGSKIQITVSSRQNPDINATCEVDYVERLGAVWLDFMRRDPVETLYSVKVYDSSSKFERMPFLPYEKTLPDYLIPADSYSIFTEAHSRESVHTIADRIGTINVTISVSPIVREYYDSKGGYPYYEFNINNTTTSGQSLFDFVQVFSYDSCSGLTNKYNNLMNFFQTKVIENPKSVFMIVSYELTTRLGFNYTGQIECTYSPESIGLVAESIELDKGSIKL